MEITTAFDDLLKHMEWADALVWAAVLSSPIAVADAPLRDRLYHVHATQYGFLQVWRGVEVDLRPGGFEDTTALARWARQYYVQLWAGAPAPTGEKAGVAVPASLVEAATAGLGPRSGTPTLGDTVLQVVTHGIYHRGQINMRLREIGCESPLTEYFVWVWLGKPGAIWPAARSEDAPN